MARITLDQVRAHTGLTEAEVSRDGRGRIWCVNSDVAERVRIAMEELYYQQYS